MWKGRSSSRWWQNVWPATSWQIITLTSVARRRVFQDSRAVWSILQWFGNRFNQPNPVNRTFMWSGWISQIPTGLFPTSFALDFFYVPSCIQSLINGYFNNFHVCYTSAEISTGWHRLEKGIAMGCSISSILFTVAFEIVLIGGRQMARGVKSQSGQWLPAIWCYMDNITTLLQAAACTTRLLKRLEELLNWVKIKPAKSCSLSIRKRIKRDTISFSVDGEEIPRLVEQPV